MGKAHVTSLLKYIMGRNNERPKRIGRDNIKIVNTLIKCDDP
jgi:hypothetical protein